MVTLNGNGSAELALLGLRGSDQAVQVEVRDGRGGVKLSAVPFPTLWSPRDLAIVGEFGGAGTAALAVLQQSDTGVRVQLKDAETGGQLRNVTFSPDYDGVDLVVLPDLNGNQRQELAVLGHNQTPRGADQVEIRDSGSGELIRYVPFGRGRQPRQLISLPNIDGTHVLAVLRRISRRVLVNDAETGSPLNALDYALTRPYRLAEVTYDGGASYLALLGVRASDRQIRADIHDVGTDRLINRVVFDHYGRTVGFISLPDINRNGVSELVRLRRQPGPQKLFVEVRDGRTGRLLQGMHF